MAVLSYSVDYDGTNTTTLKEKKTIFLSAKTALSFPCLVFEGLSIIGGFVMICFFDSDSFFAIGDNYRRNHQYFDLLPQLQLSCQSS